MYGSCAGSRGAVASTRKKTTAKAAPIPTSAPSSTQGSGRAGQRGRADLQPDVQEAAEEHQHRDRDEPRRRALGGARQEQEERQHPADDEVAPEEGCPAVVRPGEDEGDLLRQVRVPDQEILREPEVRPEGAEAEEQLPEVVQVALADLWQAPLPAQPEDREDGHRRPGQERAPDGVEAEDGARPARLDAHQPVHRGEAQRVALRAGGTPPPAPPTAGCAAPAHPRPGRAIAGGASGRRLPRCRGRAASGARTQGG